ncbi:unnamed protein product, partial [Timema podura]|nr:unnamed protein product [Timema podura]
KVGEIIANQTKMQEVLLMGAHAFNFSFRSPRWLPRLGITTTRVLRCELIVKQRRVYTTCIFIAAQITKMIDLFIWILW